MASPYDALLEEAPTQEKSRYDALLEPEPSPTPAGQIEAGNINLNNRPVVQNPDGTVSTVRSISANIDGREVLIPTVSEDGRIMSNDEAINQYRETGRNLGKFDTPASATAYAEKLHEDQATKTEKPQTLRESLGRFLGAAQDFGKGAFGDFLPPEISNTLFGGSTSGMREDEHTKPLLSPETAKNIVGELPAWAGGNTDIGRGIAEGTAGALSSFSNPEALAQLPAFAVPGVAETYALNTAAAVPKQAEQLGTIAGESGMLSKEFGKAATEAAITDLTGAAAGLHAVPRLSESLRSIVEPDAALREPVLSDRLPETTLAPEAIAETKPVAEPPPAEPILAAPNTLEVASNNLGAAQKELRVAQASGDVTRIAEAQAAQDSAIEAYMAETMGKEKAKVAEANANVTTDETINPDRTLNAATVIHPDDTAMAKQAGESLGLKYDRIMEDKGERLVQFTDSRPGREDTYWIPAGETVADLKARIAEKDAQYAEAASKAGKTEPFTVEAFRGGNEGQFYSASEQEAAGYGGEVKKETLTFDNPLRADNWVEAKKELGLPESTTMPEVIKAATDAGHDGIVWKHHGVDEYVKLSPDAATASVGPGAASIKEPLASYEERRFGKRFQEDEKIAPELREQTGNRYYEPIPNDVTVKDAADIIENRGTDESVRLVRDESFPMQPRVRVTVGEALIKKLNQSFEEATKADDPARAKEFLQQAVDTAEFLSGYGTTLGQGVQAFAIWNKLSPEGRLLAAVRIAEKSGVELKPEQIERINKLNEEIEKAPEGFQKDEKTQDLLSFMADIKGAKPSDIPTALWYSNILSGYSTQLVNTIDTALNVLSEVGTMAIANPKSIPNLVAGLYQGMIRGGFEAASVLKTGRSITGDKISQQRILERTKFGEKGGVPMSEATPTSRFMKRAFESKPASILNLWKYPLRAMIASDTVFFNSMKEARAQYLARGIAKKEGLSGDALFKRVENELNQSPEVIEAATKQAEAEGLKGLDVKRRVSEIIDQGRDKELLDNANEAAAIATYNHDPSGVLGLVAHNISNITEGFPLGKAVVPFTRIVANVANRGLNYTPWGYKRAFFGEWGGKKFASEPPTGDAYKAQLVKATLGTTAMTAVALLDANGTIQVTAKGPDNPDEAKQLQNAGWKPYSVKIGDTYYSYQNTPVNLGFAMIGHYRDAIRYNKLSEKDAQTRLAYGMLKAGSTIFDMSFLSGVSDFVSSIQGNTSSTKGAGRLFARTASSVAIPNLVKQVDKLFDPTIYQADTITQALVRETPIARSALLKPMLNALGEPIKPSQNRFFTFETKDPVWKFITEKQAWVPIPSKTTKIGDRPIKPEEYYRLIEESGPMIRDFIESNMERLNGMTGEEAQKEIRREAERARNVVKSRF